jgi:predicted CopG family antitoxin
MFPPTSLIGMFKLLLPPNLNSMTELKAIKVSKETYAELNAIAGELQVKLKRPVSIEEAMKHLINKRKKGTKITDLAGSWEVNDEELKEIKASISQAWEKWKPQKQ